MREISRRLRHQGMGQTHSIPLHGVLGGDTTEVSLGNSSILRDTVHSSSESLNASSTNDALRQAVLVSSDSPENLAMALQLSIDTDGSLAGLERSGRSDSR